MATTEQLADERKEEDGAEQLLSQIFGQVTVTFTADDRCVGPLPLDDPTFVKELQSKTGVRLKCELKYDNGEKHPTKYCLEGSWDEIARAKRYFKKWFNGSTEDRQEKKSRIPSGKRGSGIVSDLAQGVEGNGRLDLRGGMGGVGEGESEQGEDLSRNAGNQPVGMATNETEDHSGGRETSSSLPSKQRSRGNGDYSHGQEDQTNSRHGKGSPSQPKPSSDSQDYPQSSQLPGNHNQYLPSTKSRHGRREQGGLSPPSERENERHVLASESTTSDSVRDASRREHGRKESPAGPEYLVSQATDNPEAHLRDSRNQERSASQETEVRRKQSNRRQQNDRYSEDQLPQRSDTRQRTPQSPDVSPHSNMPLEDQMSSPEGAAGGRHQTSENINFVPVDAGVFCFIKKMHGAEIKNIERQFNVMISCEDIDVNESSMVKITPVGQGMEGTIRGANEAVVDLYSTVFSQLSHRVVQLEGSSIGKESLQRAMADVERLYKDVLVILSGSKVMIYGMKELDVKVAKAMVTNRLYDTGRSAPRSRHDDENHNDEGLGPDDHMTDERPPHVGLEDDRTQNVTRHQQDHRFVDDYVAPSSDSRDHHHPRGREDLRGFEADDEGLAEETVDRDQEDSSPRIPDEELTPRTDVQASSLKYRFRQDRLSFKTVEGLKVRVYQADITKEKVGAIVNAANEGLIHAGGVAGAIEKAAGPLMTSECKLYIAKHGMLYPSKVMWTTSGNLVCRHIIHAVGPRWDEYKNKEECYETLKTTFVKSLELAEKMYVAGMSLPLISSGIFGMPLTPCIDALYEAITQYSQTWNRDVNVLKEVNIVEIHSDIVKTIQEHIIQKLTGQGTGAVIRHLDPGNQDHSDIPRSRSDARESSEGSRRLEGSRTDDPRSSHLLDRNLGTSSTGLLDGRTQNDEVDDLFASNRARMTHEYSTQTSLLYQGADDILIRARLNRPSHEMNHDDTSRFGRQKFSSLPNLSPRDNDEYRERTAANNRLTGSSETRSRFSSSEVKVSTSSSASGSDVTKTLQGHEGLHKDTYTTTYKRSFDLHSSSRKPDASHGSDRSVQEITGAVGGVKENPSESLIQSILVQHESGGQTPEQAAETQKLLDNLLGGDDSSRRSREREKGHRSRRTQSLDRRVPRKSQNDTDLGGYDLHSDARVKRSGLEDDDLKKCSVCFSKINLTRRKDCEHKLCRNCHKIGLYKGTCSFCKINSSSSHHAKSVGDEQRGRSRSKKMPDPKPLTPRGQLAKDFHIRPAGISSQRKGPMTALHVTSPPSSPSHNLRMDPVGQAPDQRYGSSGQYHGTSSLSDSTKGHSTRTKAWVEDSTKPSNASTSKAYNHRTYTSNNERSSDGSRFSDRERKHQDQALTENERSSDGSSRFSARERRHRDQALADEKNDRSSSARTEEDRGRGGGLGALRGTGGDIGTSEGSNVMCPICMEVMSNPKTLSECKHTFCAACIDKAMKLKALCPICGVVYGQLYGNQPAGTMTNYVEPTDLPGYEGCGTIVISYRFPDGVQGDDHSNPGQPFRGTARMAYIPNNIEGQGVFRLLEKAFKARLLFTIGQSVTTGEQNCVIWNDVHHKTRRTGGAENHGYPDPGYLRRVKDELSVKGIK